MDAQSNITTAKLRWEHRLQQACHRGDTVVGRFAPSPSGRMHLGNIFAALSSWLSVKSRGGVWILRIEDLDPQRSRREYAEMIEDDLHWLGLEWDEGGLENIGSAAPYIQSQRSDIYADALNYLAASGLLYTCSCRRADILATQAPHQSDGRIIYPGTCRPTLPTPLTLNQMQGMTLRLRVDGVKDEIQFEDRICGPQSVNLDENCGDFIVRRADGAQSYQLAVVVDDILMGITEVVRGDDLLLSAAQQIYLYRLLGAPAPQFAHIPLLKNRQGIRLSKRDNAMSMESLRNNFTPAQLLGKLAHIAGWQTDDTEISLGRLLENNFVK